MTAGGLALVLIWCSEAPERIGELLLPRTGLVRDRPGRAEPTGPIASAVPALEKLIVSEHGPDSIEVKSPGKTLRHEGRDVAVARVGPNETLQVGAGLLLLCVRRPAHGWSLGPADRVGAFGQPDDDGIAGESPAAWDLRHRIAFVGPRAEHVIVCGESGTGKELVARAIHRASLRGRRPLVAGNVTAFTDALVELFGNGEGYPRPGMPERQGLVGRAEGSTLLLDDIGELPEQAWSRLARLLEAGEYRRLGDGRVFRADVRVVATTSRPSAIPYELGSRLELRVDVPGLDVRREDIPLLARCFVDRAAAQGRAEPVRLSLDFVRALVAKDYAGHVRELEALLSKSARASDPGWLTSAPAPSVRPASASGGPFRNEIPPPPSRRPGPRLVDAARVQACLDENDGNIESTWRALGFTNRHVLARIIKKHGLRTR